jgi:gliding motility-associated-like protein
LAPATVANFSEEDAGRYYLDVYNGSCLAQQTSIIVQGVAFPDFKVSSSSSGLVCQGKTVSLSLIPATSNVSYQWFEKTTGVISGQTSPTLPVSAGGNYFSKVTSTIYSSCPAAFSDTVSVTVVSVPVPSFSVATTTPCVGQLLTFNNQSTTDPQTTAIYTWNFGDYIYSNDINPTHSYNSASTFNAKLVITYAGGICRDSTIQQLTVQAAPSLSITSSSGLFSFCEGTVLTLQANGSGFDTNSYHWSNSATSPSTNVKTGGTYSVSATATAGGCVITAIQDVTQLPAPIITVSATPPAVNEGEPTQLSASGIINYSWHPGKTLSDSTIANPIATPKETTVYTVSGKGGNGCVGLYSISVKVNGESIIKKLKAHNFFSPGNGDDTNEKWEVEPITTYPQCGVTIYDEKGMKVYEAKPYLNDWAGTFNGHVLPEGVYYYIIRCDGESTPKTGSITLIR